MELFSQNLTFNETTQKQKAVRFGTVQFIPNDQYNNSIINDEKIQPLDLDEMVDVDTETTVDPFLLITKNEEHPIKIEEQLVKFSCTDGCEIAKNLKSYIEEQKLTTKEGEVVEVDYMQCGQLLNYLVHHNFLPLVLKSSLKLKEKILTEEPKYTCLQPLITEYCLLKAFKDLTQKDQKTEK